jgi:dipeptidyl aminopeptidase/acylaminoacyl peptidase
MARIAMRGDSLLRCLGSTILFLAAGCAPVQPGTLVDREGWSVRREFLPHPQDKNRKIEVFWTKPAGEGPYPAVLFVHGHQEEIRDGGGLYVRTGRLATLARRGYVAASLSQPGYGYSDGPADFCGPFTQEAALAALAFLRQQHFVRPDKVALYGYSRGAIVAAMAATRDPRLAALVLGGGAYDFFSWYPAPLPGINANIDREAGRSDDAFMARSALYHAGKIRAPVLLLHGAADERIPAAQARAFATKLEAAGIPVTLRIFADTRHGIPAADQYREVYPFLEARLR